MAAQRKVFRIEEMMRDAGYIASPAVQPAGFDDIMVELKALRATIAAQPSAAPAELQQKLPAGDARKLKIELDVIGDAIRQTKSEIATLQDRGFDGARVARVGQELQAVVADTGNCTDKILRAAEQIDEIAETLLAGLKNEHEQGLVQDIQERITQIFEACNFHDLTGQRVSKVGNTLQLIEDHIARMTEIWSVIERFAADEIAGGELNPESLLNGPKLDGEAGHSSQDDIDALFH